MILIHRGEKHYVTEGLAQICSRGHDEFPMLDTFNTDQFIGNFLMTDDLLRRTRTWRQLCSSR